MARGDVLLVRLPDKTPDDAPAAETEESADTAETVGREQAGPRPGLVVSIDNRSNPLITVIPGTKNMKIARYPYTLRIEPTGPNGLDLPTILMVFQIRAISNTRIIRKLGVLEADSVRIIDRMIKELLGY